MLGSAAPEDDPPRNIEYANIAIINAIAKIKIEDWIFILIMTDDSSSIL